MKTLIPFVVAVFVIILFAATNQTEHERTFELDGANAIVTITGEEITITLSEPHYYNINVDDWGVSLDAQESGRLIIVEHNTTFDSWDWKTVIIKIQDMTTGVTESCCWDGII